MHRIAGWWDGFELWVAGLPFLPQFAIVLIGMVPVSFAIAYLLDRGLRTVLRMLGRDRTQASGPMSRPRETGPGSCSAEDEPDGPEFIGPEPFADSSPFSGAARSRQKETV